MPLCSAAAAQILFGRAALPPAGIVAFLLLCAIKCTDFLLSINVFYINNFMVDKIAQAA